MRAVSVLFAALTLSVSVASHAAPLTVGTYDGPIVASTGFVQDPSSPLSYANQVFADPRNPFCKGCLDFVIVVNNPETSLYGGTGVNTFGFAGYKLGLAYAAGPGTAPDSATISNGGDTVSFAFNLFIGTFTNPLIIYTNALDFTEGGITLDALATDPPAFAPSGTPVEVATTPEPSSIALLGTGMLGLVGAARSRLQKR